MSSSVSKTNMNIVLNNINKQWLKLLNTNDLPDIINSITKSLDVNPDDYNSDDEFQISIKPKIVPPLSQIFEFARLTDLSNIKVVIIGQDPYPKEGDAHGLAFSCLNGIPASLRNIYKCLEKNKLIDEIPKTGNLTNWARQGVLLINTALTTIQGEPTKHSDIWQSYTTKLISNLASMRPLVFMLWGKHAKSFTDTIMSANASSYVLSWAHPSPMAQSTQSFIDCTNFTDANKWLIDNKLSAIDWNVNDIIDKTLYLTPRTTVVFTDGSCNPNKACPESRAGYASAFARGPFTDVVLYGNIECDKHYATSQRAEGTAIWKILIFLLDHIDEWDALVIISDSDFWIQMFNTYMPAWESAKTDFNTKKNPDMTTEMWALYNKLTLKYEKTIDFRHMKSHNKDGWGTSDDPYKLFCYDNNDYVDRMATYARTKLLPGVHKIGKVKQ